jgi:hypothetical protein
MIFRDTNNKEQINEKKKNPFLDPDLFLRLHQIVKIIESDARKNKPILQNKKTVNLLKIVLKTLLNHL